MTTFPAEFSKVVETVQDLDPPAGTLACDWGNAQACTDDNTLRAEFAGAGLREYAKRTTELDEPIDSVISDFLNDLRHLCDALGLDFDALADDRHYQCELEGRF